MNDKSIEALAGIACLIVLAVLIYIDPTNAAFAIPAILAIVASLTAYESGRRHGRRRSQR